MIEVVACALGLGVGLSGLAAACFGGDGPAFAVTGRGRRLFDGHQARRLGVAGAVAGLVTLLTRWPVAFPVAFAAGLGLPVLFGQTAGSVSVVRVEAVATWTEMLQGTLAASAGLAQAILATAPLAPVPIRSATVTLASRLGAGMAPGAALVGFADELHDQSADRVVCALLLASTSRAQRTGDLLAALARSTRNEVAMRLRIETSRASVRSGVRTVLVFSVGFALALVLLARSYLAPFGTAAGQVMLAVVAALYGIGLTLMAKMAAPPSPVRLLGQGVEQ